MTYANKDTLALEVDVRDRELVGERHVGVVWGYSVFEDQLRSSWCLNEQEVVLDN